jgi:glycosyltransferase involved in cell wall biosynthesis
MAKVPVIVPSFHLPQAGRKPRRRLMIRLLSLWSDRVIAVSQAVAENLTREIGIPTQKLRVIHNGVDLNDFVDLPSKEEVREWLGIPSGSWVIGVAGRMKPQKGFEYLLKALPLLEEEGLRDYRVMMVGDGPVRPILERQADELGCKDKVKFLGFRRDVPQLLRAMDLFAFPSLWEGFGTALVEAMVAEVPIVASDLPCVREIIPDERYGLLTPPRNPEALAAGILRIWRDAETKASLKTTAKDRAVQFFSLGRVVETYQGLFQEILAEKKVGGRP